MDCFGFVYSDGTSKNSCGGPYAGVDTADFCRNGCPNCGAGDYYCQNGVCDGKLTLPTGEYITELTQYTNAGSASASLSATGLRVKTSAGKDTLLKGHGYTNENPNVVTGSLTFNSKTLQTVAGESCGQATTTTQASADGYTKTPGERCVNQWDAFNTIQEAKVACTAKAQCTGIYDSTFFGGGIVLCWTSRKESDRNANEYTYWKQAR